MDSGVCAGSNSLELVMLGFPQLLRAYAVVLLAGFTIPLLAGDSGLNVAVVVNQSSSDSVALGNYYCERRQVPPQNQLRIHWDGGPVSWTRSQFDETLVSPLGAMLSSRGLTNQINAVLLSMDIPYRVADQGEGNSTTSVLFYGFKTNDVSDSRVCRIAPNSDSDYAGSETAFRLSSPGTNAGAYLATMLTGNTLQDAENVVDRGVQSDGSFPTANVLLEKTSDPSRNVRFGAFDNAVFDMRLNQRFRLIRTNSDVTFGLTNLLGLETGLAQLAVSPGSFVPGAMADSLTSYGGLLFEDTGQTTLLAFLRAGATGSFGTVVEPCAFTVKFPDPIGYFYQARGFNLVECYYQSVFNPYEGLVVGEPLAAPFAQSGSGSWLGLAPNTVLVGATNLALTFTAADASRPLQQVDLFVDGIFAYSITNIAPAAGNQLTITLNGAQLDYTVPPDATLQSVSAGLADLLNAKTDQTQVKAFLTGDRMELEWMDVETAGADVTLTVNQASGSADELTSFLATARPTFLDTVAFGSRTFQISGQAGLGDFIQLTGTKTNGDSLTLSVTNTEPPISVVQLTQQLLGLIDAAPALQLDDGFYSGDVITDGSATNVTFTLYARSLGLPAAQIQVDFQASTNLTVLPGGSSKLDQSDWGQLQPRNHLYVTTGVTNLNMTFPFDTTAFADGFHELTAVAYEGSDVRTQTRATQIVQIQNTPLRAMLAVLRGGTNTAVETTLQFEVQANRADIARIDLFSTGGWLASATNLDSATFSIGGTNLGVGLHPFYAMVIAGDGAQYRTEIKSIRLAGLETSLALAISAQPVTLTWPAVPGRFYDVLASDAVSGPFQVEATLLASETGSLTWRAPPPLASRQYFLVRTPSVSSTSAGNDQSFGLAP